MTGVDFSGIDMTGMNRPDIGLDAIDCEAIAEEIGIVTGTVIIVGLEML